MLKEEKIGEILRKIEKVEGLSSYALMKVDQSPLSEGNPSIEPTSGVKQKQT